MKRMSTKQAQAETKSRLDMKAQLTKRHQEEREARLAVIEEKEVLQQRLQQLMVKYENASE